MYSLSDQSIYRRFFSTRTDMPHEYLQKFVVIDYTQKMVILVVLKRREKEEIVGMGQYAVGENTQTADVAVVVRDDYQNRGIGTELVSYLSYLAKKQGLLGFTADILLENRPMFHIIRIFEQMGFEIEKKMEGGVFQINIAFRKK